MQLLNIKIKLTKIKTIEQKFRSQRQLVIEIKRKRKRKRLEKMCAKIEQEQDTNICELRESCSLTETSADLRRKRLVTCIRAIVKAVKVATSYYDRLNQMFLNSNLYK